MTDGTAITLSLVDGRVIGTAGTDSVNTGLSGKVAFAIALDPVTGEMYVAQYLSLHQDSLTTTPNDFVTLAANTLGVTVRLTDGDGDQVTSVAADVSNHVQFADDGPTAPTVTVSAATVGVDETPGVQDAAAIVAPAVPAETDIAGSTLITFGGASTTVAGVFAGVVNAGVDPDVPGTALDHGALSFASSTGDVLNVPSLATLIANGAFGADGPAATNPVSYALTVTNPTPAGLTLTDGTAITLSLVTGW